MSLLIPNVGDLNLKLKKFADHINADEVSQCTCIVAENCSNLYVYNINVIRNTLII